MKEKKTFDIWEYYKDWMKVLATSHHITTGKNPPPSFNDYMTKKKEETNDN